MKIPKTLSRPVIYFFWLVLLGLFGAACKPDAPQKKVEALPEMAIDSTFDPALWQQKEEDKFPYRERMYRQLLYSDTLRQRTKAEIVRLLGEPDRTGEGHIYYQVKGTQVGPVLFFSKFLVFKFTEADSVEWIKVYE
jgi:hypothetical protein